MNNTFRNIIFHLLALLLTACEKEIEIKPNDGKDLIVVEGHIEPDWPPYVILTRSQTFFSASDASSIGAMFVKGANVVISDGDKTVTLHELASDDLPAALLDSLSRRVGLPLASPNNPDGLKAIIYTTTELAGREGGVYTLTIEADGRWLSAVTTIPKRIELDSVWTIPHPHVDTLRTLMVRYTDPPAEENHVRYFTSVNGGFFFPPYFSSVLDESTYFNANGKTFDIPLEKGHNRYSDIDFSIYSYFAASDTIALRWCAIDRAHFRFWSTAEFNRNSGGNPFSNPTHISSNIKGGLGVWGGYNPTYYILFPTGN